MHIDARVLVLRARRDARDRAASSGSSPALQASKPDLVPALKSGVGSGAQGRGLLRGSLVVAQISLSRRSRSSPPDSSCAASARRSAMDTGFRAPEQVLLVSTDLFLAGYNPSTGRVLDRQLLERVEALPGVTSASFAGIVPLGFGGNNSSGVTIEGYVPQKDENMSIHNDDVGPRYFETLGTPHRSPAATSPRRTIRGRCAS